jgi:hypothetical protein
MSAEIWRLNADVADAATKNRTQIAVGSKCAFIVALRLSISLRNGFFFNALLFSRSAREPARGGLGGYVKETEADARLQEAQERSATTEAAVRRSKSDVNDLTDVLNDKNKKLEDIVDE